MTTSPWNENPEQMRMILEEWISNYDSELIPHKVSMVDHIFSNDIQIPIAYKESTEWLASVGFPNFPLSAEEEVEFKLRFL